MATGARVIEAWSSGSPGTQVITVQCLGKRSDGSPDRTGIGPEPPHLVAPAARNLADRQPGQTPRLLNIDATLGFDHACRARALFGGSGGGYFSRASFNFSAIVSNPSFRW
ncbi:hypothetical protein [Amycolatopsis albispora]|uniref:Uncharacterized protein n=1 Tax=Amycolatopsis albispora TaxID=1804986 RepID=A0A344L077_9PSEU|nr:hypothetical protein [Amycolatopsis albispora]AXB41451.1 hypothetical protein A4R43_02020 [Amycolatopsis albispora]